MSDFIYARKESVWLKAISLFVCVSFLFSTTIAPVFAQGIITPFMPQPGTMVATSDAFVPVMLKGVTLHSDDPFKFDFIVDSGEMDLTTDELREESDKLVKYFLASMTIPKDDLWVNLSPHEQNRIIPDALSKTELGRDLLAQDYLLKQVTSTLMYPENELGSEFWQKIYEKAQEKYGTTDIPIDTFNKVWILPDEATVYENGSTVYVVESKLKVMLDSDYVAMTNNEKIHVWEGLKPSHTENDLSISANIIREIILPAIEKEVNTGKNFAPLRQIYNSLILAKWYKETIKESILNKVYIDKKKTNGIDLVGEGLKPSLSYKEKIYDQYMQAYKKGVYNYIKEEYDTLSQSVIPRKYFSGGFKDSAMVINRSSKSETIKKIQAMQGVTNVVNIDINPQKNGQDYAMLGNGEKKQIVNKVFAGFMLLGGLLIVPSTITEDKMPISLNVIGDKQPLKPAKVIVKPILEQGHATVYLGRGTTKNEKKYSNKTGFKGIKTAIFRIKPGVFKLQEFGGIAVDPKVIPLGSNVKITFSDGTQVIFEAADIGPEVKGNEIDLSSNVISLGLRRFIEEKFEGAVVEAVNGKEFVITFKESGTLKPVAPSKIEAGSLEQKKDKDNIEIKKTSDSAMLTSSGDLADINLMDPKFQAVYRVAKRINPNLDVNVLYRTYLDFKDSKIKMKSQWAREDSIRIETNNDINGYFGILISQGGLYKFDSPNEAYDVFKRGFYFGENDASSTEKAKREFFQNAVRLTSGESIISNLKNEFNIEDAFIIYEGFADEDSGSIDHWGYGREYSWLFVPNEYREFVDLYLRAGSYLENAVNNSMDSTSLGIDLSIFKTGNEKLDKHFKSIFDHLKQIHPNVNAYGLFEHFHNIVKEHGSEFELGNGTVVVFKDQVQNHDRNYIGEAYKEIIRDNLLINSLKETLGIDEVTFKMTADYTYEQYPGDLGYGAMNEDHYYTQNYEDSYITSAEHDALLRFALLIGQSKLKDLLSGGTGTVSKHNELLDNNIGILGKTRGFKGGKESGFLLFERLDLRYPKGVVISKELAYALDQFPKEHKQEAVSYILETLRSQGMDLVKDKLAVRSNPKLSSPGTFSTKLNVEIDEHSILKAINFVLSSWYDKKASDIRRKASVSDEYDLPIIIQLFKSGKSNDPNYLKNMEVSPRVPLYASGVFSTRNPSTAENILYGRYAVNMDGEQLMTKGEKGSDISEIEKLYPEIYNQLLDAKDKLEQAAGPQEVEFVVNDGIIYFLQTRKLNFAPQAEIKYLQELLAENKITEARAIPLIEELHKRINSRKTYRIKDGAKLDRLAYTETSTPGAMQGYLVWTEQQAKALIEKNLPVILVILRAHNSNDMLPLVFDNSLSGLITGYGNNMSHEAVLTRLAGVPSLINFEMGLGIDYFPIEKGSKPLITEELFSYLVESKYINEEGVLQPKYYRSMYDVDESLAKFFVIEEGSKSYVEKLLSKILQRRNNMLLKIFNNDEIILLREGDMVAIDGDNGLLFSVPDAADVLEDDGVILDASYGINVNEFRKEFLSRFLNEFGEIKDGFTLEVISELNDAAALKFNEVSRSNDKKAAFIANLEKHFLHDLLKQAQVLYSQTPADTAMLVNNKPEDVGGIDIARTENSDTRGINPSLEKEEVGGIDLNNIDVNKQGEGVDINFDKGAFDELNNMEIDGFKPVIINIIPITSVLPLLGLAPKEEDDEAQMLASVG